MLQLLGERVLSNCFWQQATCALICNSQILIDVGRRVLVEPNGA
ncbi:hypothetical protein BLA39750_04927 [Burkholderia lata]|uniref:Uncharacterized protein n=1 Tax=Burkholderia lata (strain ATCC 17760 / DSM 23089 / LMG 22485 / NCIMB 9086 / R18194 / 383) TaxID=482957 RepID=A0A6P2ZK08_BURL3|nr:hypothetical protein BLA39750_04927 [Burkholderia lata]